MYYVYILHSLKDHQLYTGYTSDLKKRLREHNNGYNLSTKQRRPLKLVYYEASEVGEDCQAREKYLKSGKGKKYLGKRLRRFLAKQRSGFAPLTGSP